MSHGNTLQNNNLHRKLLITAEQAIHNVDRILLKTHTLPVVSSIFIIGIVCGEFSSPLAVSFIIPLILLTIVVFLLLRKQKKLSYFLLFFLYFLLGVLAIKGEPLHGTLSNLLPNTLKPPFEATVVGKIRRIYGFKNGKTSFEFDTYGFQTVERPLTPVHLRIKFTIRDQFTGYKPGDSLAIRAKLKRPTRYLSPGSFDTQAFLAQKKIYLTGFIPTPLYCQNINYNQSLTEKIKYGPEIVRFNIINSISSLLDGDKAAIYKAILTGDKKDIPSSLLQRFRESGCLHILAISGMHMSLLAFLLYFLFFWLLRKSTWCVYTLNTRKTALSLTVPLLLFYAFIAGANPPVLRSLIMSLVLIGAVCLNRRHSVLHMLALAALILLAFSPRLIFTASFQLSFTAVLSIVLSLPFIMKLREIMLSRMEQGYLHTCLLWIFGSILVSFAVTLGTAPVTLHHFHTISIIGPIANLLVEPIICLWTLTLGFIAIPFIFFFPPIADFFLNLGGLGISLSIYLVKFFSSFHFSSFILPSPTFLTTLFYYLSLALFLNYKLLNRQLLISNGLIFSITLFFIFYSPYELMKAREKTSRITFLDVGQGSCTLIEMVGGKRIMIDGGAVSYGDYDVGERIIAPFLLHKGIQSIDTVAVTHSDSDHYNGLSYILKNFNVQKLLINQPSWVNPAWAKMVETAFDQGTAVLLVKPKDQYHCDDSACFSVEHNLMGNEITEKSNDNGIIFKYEHGAISLLLPGDISKKGENLLLGTDANLQSTLLLSPHHGSSGSNSSAFLQKVNPEVIIVSSGKGRKNSFPSAKVMERFNGITSNTILTRKHGTTVVTIYNNSFEIDTFSEGRTIEKAAEE